MIQCLCSTCGLASQRRAPVNCHPPLTMREENPSARPLARLGVALTDRRHCCRCPPWPVFPPWPSDQCGTGYQQRNAKSRLQRCRHVACSARTAPNAAPSVAIWCALCVWPRGGTVGALRRRNAPGRSCPTAHMLATVLLSLKSLVHCLQYLAGFARWKCVFARLIEFFSEGRLNRAYALT